MDVVPGVASLRPEHGPLFAVVGVFDGLHRGHVYLLAHLVREATARSARAGVITFDHHPDEVLTGAAPPLLIDPTERLDRLSAAGVEVTVVQHFDEVVRRTSYGDFIATIRSGAGLSGLLMTPDAAFGHERRGTPTTLAELGDRDGFAVVVVPPFVLDGQAVRSSAIRAAVTAGDLAGASRLLGRPFTITGDVDGQGRMLFELPMALPPDGAYRANVDDQTTSIDIRQGTVHVRIPASGRITFEVLGP